jgi:hypothetical protein
VLLADSGRAGAVGVAALFAFAGSPFVAIAPAGADGSKTSRRSAHPLAKGVSSMPAIADRGSGGGEEQAMRFQLGGHAEGPLT